MKQLSPGIALHPDDISIVQRVFKEIIAEPWFERTYDNERDCSGLVAKALYQGMKNERILKRYATNIAHQRFAKALIS